MRFLIVDGDYPEFVRLMYEQNPALGTLSYEEQMRFRDRSLSGWFHFFCANLQKLGHEARDVRVNDEILQRTWAREHSIPVGKSWRWKWKFRMRRGLVPWVDRVPNQWTYEILAAQIKHYQPDVVIDMIMGALPPSFIREMKPHIGLLIGWGYPPFISYRRDPAALRDAYDMVIAPSEAMVDYCRAQGMKTELVRHAFEPGILPRLVPAGQRKYPIAFAGLLRTDGYAARIRMLEALCAGMGKDMHVWATSIEGLAADSPIRNCHEGNAWGEEMFRVLAQSKIVWNCHSNFDHGSADNLRLFEATGMSACLLTDWKANLPNMFDVGKEVLAYKSTDECIEMCRYYLDHDREREEIAKAGHQRTLREHTFWHRAQELSEIAQKYLSHSGRRRRGPAESSNHGKYRSHKSNHDATTVMPT